MMLTATRPAIGPRFRAEIYDGLYWAIFVAFGAVFAISPAIGAYASWVNLDRVADAFLLVLLTARLAELTMIHSARMSSRGCLLLFFLSVFLFSSLANYVADDFVVRLFLLEAKLPLFCVLLGLFGGRTLPSHIAKRLSTFILLCLVIAFLVYLLVSGAPRLRLFSESNYSAIAAFLTIVGFIAAHRVRPFSRSWFLCASLLLAIIVASQSRTAMAIFIAYMALLLVRDLSLLGASAVVTMAVLAYGLVDQYVLDVLFRGLGSANLVEIDRFVFLREFFDYLEREGWERLLFALKVGTYLSYDVSYMGYWVARQSAEHGIDFGLAPFNFHSGYLRMLGAYGLIPTLAILVYVFSLLRTRSWELVLIVCLSLVSMSTLYLSSVIPFLILTMIVMPVKSRLPEPAAYGEPRFHGAGLR